MMYLESNHYFSSKKQTDFEGQKGCSLERMRNPGKIDENKIMILKKQCQRYDQILQSKNNLQLFHQNLKRQINSKDTFQNIQWFVYFIANACILSQDITLSIQQRFIKTIKKYFVTKWQRQNIKNSFLNTLKYIMRKTIAKQVKQKIVNKIVSMLPYQCQYIINFIKFKYLNDRQYQSMLLKPINQKIAALGFYLFGPNYINLSQITNYACRQIIKSCDTLSLIKDLLQVVKSDIYQSNLGKIKDILIGFQKSFAKMVSITQKTIRLQKLVDMSLLEERNLSYQEKQMKSEIIEKIQNYVNERYRQYVLRQFKNEQQILVLND